jgi:hypothetical protein
MSSNGITGTGYLDDIFCFVGSTSKAYAFFVRDVSELFHFSSNPLHSNTKTGMLNACYLIKLFGSHIPVLLWRIPDTSRRFFPGLLSQKLRHHGGPE